MATRDPLAIRTVVVSGLPESVDSKALWKKIRKLEGAEKIDWPVKVGELEDAHTGKSNPNCSCIDPNLYYIIAHAFFASPAAATAAVSKLHAHVFKGSLLSATLKKRLDGATKALTKAPKTEQSKPSIVTPSRANRLIIRNLPFNITEQDIRALFLPYGPIHSIDIPTIVDANADNSESERKKPRIKGFAFVWMLSRKDAEKAMDGCNGRVVQAGMADTLMLDKQKKKKQRREEKKRSVAETKGEDAEDEVNARDQRVVAVDWAISKDKWEKEKARLEDNHEEDVEMTELEGDEASGSDEIEGSNPGDEASGSETDEDAPLGVHYDEDLDNELDAHDESEGSDDDMEPQTPVKPSLPPPEMGTTVFIRNVPFEATEDELRTLYVVCLNPLSLFSSCMYQLDSELSVRCDTQESQ